MGIMTGLISNMMMNKSLENNQQNKFPVVIFAFVPVILFMILVSIISGGFSPTLAQSFGQEIALYKESTIISSDIPRSLPLGGNGFDFTKITAGYFDQSYKQNFGKDHDAIDIIPTQNYYNSNLLYQKTNKPFVFATCNGNAKSNKDLAGGISVNIICNDQKHKVMILHESQVFVSFKKEEFVTAGQPIGIMGCTGKCTGDHVHYAVWELINEKWETINPLTTIKK